jgi:hypothetical protein
MPGKEVIQMSLTRDEILSAKDIEVERVSVPEWGGYVHVKGMTGTERDAFEASVVEQRGTDAKVNMVNIRAKLAAQTICDEEGKRLFTKADIKKLGEKSANALDRVFAVAQRLSGISENDVEELAEELEKNPFDGSPSD